MTVQCIGCRHFTVKHRLQHERTDKGMRAQGCGRCQLDKEVGRYRPARTPRSCADYAPISADQVAQREAYLVKQHQIYLTTP
jgi:hypothetical protein